MTHTDAAGAAKTQQQWSKVLRITEAAAGLASTPRASSSATALSALREGLIQLQTAWKWLEGKRIQQIASKRLRVAETISLGEKRTISIVTVDGAQYLIGSSSGGVQLLTRLDEPTTQTSRIEVSQ